MKIAVRLFASMAEDAGTGIVELDLPEGGCLSDAIAVLRGKFPGMSWPKSVMVAVNQEYSELDRELHEGDEVAVIPPVSGGSGGVKGVGNAG